MVRIEVIARAALRGRALRVRSLVQDLMVENRPLAATPAPRSANPTERAVAAGLIELFASRLGEPAPDWSAEIGALDTPIYLVRFAATMPRLRELCELHGPEPLRRRLIYAPPDYLHAA